MPKLSPKQIKRLNGSYNRSSFHCICCWKVLTLDGQWEHLLCQSFGTSYDAKIPTKKKGTVQQTSEFCWISKLFCFGFLSKLQRLMPLAPRKLLSKCPPAHKCVVHGLSWNPTYLSVCRWISVMCDGHRHWRRKDYLWSDMTIDAKTEKQILIYLGQWKTEIHKTTLSFLTLI